MATTTLLQRKQQTIHSSTKSDNEDVSVFHQLKSFRSQIPKEKLFEWETPSGPITFKHIVRDWGIIFAATQLYMRIPNTLTLMVAIVLISWGQRGLSNLAHDSIHRNLVAKKKWNDIMANTLLAPAFLTTAKLQRDSHAAHHHYLGTSADPDHGIDNATSLKHYRVKLSRHLAFSSVTDSATSKTGHAPSSSIPMLFLYDLFDPVLWYQNAIGSLTSAPFFLTSWWTVVTILSSYLEPSPSGLSPLFSHVPSCPQAIPLTLPVLLTPPFRLLARIPTFPLLYHFTRLTLTHIMYVLRETIDHSGLQPTSILAFTRSSPCCNWAQVFLQPHDDNYHLLHHLLPRVPGSRLHEAHLWLVEHCTVYREAETRSETYFSGSNPLFGEVISQVDAGFEDRRGVVLGNMDGKMI